MPHSNKILYVSPFYLEHYIHHLPPSVADQTVTQGEANLLSSQNHSSGVADPVRAYGEH